MLGDVWKKRASSKIPPRKPLHAGLAALVGSQDEASTHLFSPPIEQRSPRSQKGLLNPSASTKHPSPSTTTVRPI